MVERYAHLAPDHLANAANRLDSLFVGYILATSETKKRPAENAKSPVILGSRLELEPGTCGLTVGPSVGKSFLIRLLQHTPSFKSSYEQPKSSCKALSEVTKWLRSLSSR